MSKRWSSFWEIHKTGFQLLGLVKTIHRNLIPMAILAAVIGAAVPYVSIIGSARIIDLLLSGLYKEAILSALLMFVLIFVLQIANTILDGGVRAAGLVLQEELQVMVRKKGMELDYTTMDDPEILEEVSNAESAARFRSGLDAVLFQYKDLLQQVLGMATAVGLMISFCLKRADSTSSIMNFFANPLVCAGCSILTWAAIMMISRKQSNQMKAKEDSYYKAHHVFENSLSYWSAALFQTKNGETIRVNGMQEVMNHNIEINNQASLPFYKARVQLRGKKEIWTGIQGGVFTIVIHMLALNKVLLGAITLGAFSKYAGAFQQFHMATAKMVWSQNELHRAAQNLVPILHFLKRENKMKTGTIHVEKRQDHVYEIAFHDVSFRYPGSDKDCLKHVSAELTLKDKIAVVGKNGAGKSTFIKLLCRIYDPTEGVITLNGIDIRKYKYEEYLKLFAVVFQDFHLFGCSIAENVAASTQYQTRQVEQCLEEAGVLQFVSELPDGMQTVLQNADENGVDVSGGQGQKLSIARALYQDAPFVILDEPTAALDPISEAEIYERFHEMVHDKTSIYISHRMSSCRFCDQIVVFEQGQIVERGSHETLLQNEGTYHDLWTAQAQYYA